MKHLHYALILLIVAVALAGCATESNLLVRVDRTAELDVSVGIRGVALAYLRDLGEASGVSFEESGIFDVEQITGFFEMMPLIEPLEASTPDRASLDVRLAITDLSALFSGASFNGIPDILVLKEQNGVSRLQLSFQRDNMHQLSELLPFGDDPVSSSLLMLFDDYGSKAEFEEMISWLFEEYASAAEILDSLHAAEFSISLQLPRSIISTNMQRLGATSVQVVIPVIDFFTLEQPIRFFAEY